MGTASPLREKEAKALPMLYRSGTCSIFEKKV
jgi:hypothetical protein